MFRGLLVLLAFVCFPLNAMESFGNSIVECWNEYDNKNGHFKLSNQEIMNYCICTTEKEVILGIIPMMSGDGPSYAAIRNNTEKDLDYLKFYANGRLSLEEAKKQGEMRAENMKLGVSFSVFAVICDNDTKELKKIGFFSAGPTDGTLIKMNVDILEGVNILETDTVAEVAFMTKQEFSERGVASGITKSFCDIASIRSDLFKTSHFYATCHRENIYSKKVLTKNGFNAANLSVNTRWGEREIFVCEIYRQPYVK
ncbi:MAG: GNAT family N-acetyltransferase [Holosporaceae bacterium]|jgi:hypothetical protein|nr:GNAT family N-acetyltransferase [Holosporaceae bacterium]